MNESDIDGIPAVRTSGQIARTWRRITGWRMQPSNPFNVNWRLLDFQSYLDFLMRNEAEWIPGLKDTCLPIEPFRVQGETPTYRLPY